MTIHNSSGTCCNECAAKMTAVPSFIKFTRGNQSLYGAYTFQPGVNRDHKPWNPTPCAEGGLHGMTLVDGTVSEWDNGMIVTATVSDFVIVYIREYHRYGRKRGVSAGTWIRCTQFEDGLIQGDAEVHTNGTIHRGNMMNSCFVSEV